MSSSQSLSPRTLPDAAPGTPQESQPDTPQVRSQGLRLALIFLALTVVLSLLWSHARLMWNDEFLSFYGDRSPTMLDVIRVQLHYPISLDPPTYHLLSHLSMRVIGQNEMALRLPALLGFLLLQIGLFFFVRRMAGSRAAVVALAFPLLTASFRYSVEGRPYGLLLGLYAVSLVCWQSATRGYDSASDPGHEALRRRLVPLLGITFAIALAITSHYFGVLILVPICFGELARTIHRRRFDFGVLGAILAGAASIALILPFQKALMVYRHHYYITGVNKHDITQAYRELFLRYTHWPIPIQRAVAMMLAVGTLALAAAAYRRFRRRATTEPAHEWFALLAIAILPFFGYLFGRFVTHTMEVRYVIAALFAFAACIAIVMEGILRRDRIFYTAVAVLGFGALLINIANIAEERRDSRAILASFSISPSAAAAILSDPGRRIYTQSLNDFYLDSYYAPDPSLRPRFSLLYGQREEIQWLGHDTNFVTAQNMQHFTPLTMTSYHDFLAEPHPLLVLNHTGWEWIDKDLAANETRLKPLGTFMRGDLVMVQTSAHAIIPTAP